MNSKIIIAGGLNSNNISSLLEVYQPFGIDVASGVFGGKLGDGLGNGLKNLDYKAAKNSLEFSGNTILQMGTSEMFNYVKNFIFGEEED